MSDRGRRSCECVVITESPSYCNISPLLRFCIDSENHCDGMALLGVMLRPGKHGDFRQPHIGTRVLYQGNGIRAIVNAYIVCSPFFHSILVLSHTVQCSSEILPIYGCPNTYCSFQSIVRLIIGRSCLWVLPSICLGIAPSFFFSSYCCIQGQCSRIFDSELANS
jgi:hypothetical protein